VQNFKLWLENSQITITYDTLTKALNREAEKLIDSIHERKYQVSMFKPEPFFQEIKTNLATYPLIDNLLRALYAKNTRYIYDQMEKLRKWLFDQPYSQSEKMRDSARKIYTYLDTLEAGRESKEEDIHQLVNKTITGTKQNMEKIKQIIEGAISRISMWHDSPINVDAHYSESQDGILFEPGDGAQIEVGKGDMSPSFTFFQIEGKIVIDDVLDGGDPDFFTTTELQSDYFNLVNELRKPGSTNISKTLTLYTARPTKDRNLYMNATTVPSIFLTNKESHAEDLARDLPGGKRDIWKIRIDSRYVTQTLDYQGIKEYQITTPNAPVKSIQLISASE